MSTTRRRRRLPLWILLLTFVVVPLIELYVLIQVGRVIGPWWTILLLVADSIFGAWLIKREGGRTWQALNSSIGSGRMPAKELADGTLVLAGGALMLAPGFVTDIFGFLLILPFTRPLFRGMLTRAAARRMVVSYPGAPSPGAPNAPRPGPGSANGSVVQGEVIDEEGDGRV